MTYTVTVRKKTLKNLLKLSDLVQQKFKTLLKVLNEAGTDGTVKWQNYSKLGENNYHCHLTYHYVACWRQEKNTIIIEV